MEAAAKEEDEEEDEDEQEALLDSGTRGRVTGTAIELGLMEVTLGTYSRISPGSSGSGPQGSCSLQDNLPSSLEMNSIPSRCSLQ